MSEQPLIDPLGQFLGDLSAIREKKNVSLDEIRAATKVYPHIISQFESNGLKDHPLFNSLYVRAFVRSYAKAVGISPEEAVSAYDGALAGKYDRKLAIEHLDLPYEEIEALRQAQEDLAKSQSVFSVDNFEFGEGVDAGNNNKNRDLRPAASENADAIRSTAAITYIPRQKTAAPASSLGSITDNMKTGLGSFLHAGKESALFQWGLLTGGIVLALFVILQLVATQGPAPVEPALQRPNLESTSVSNALTTPIEEPDTVQTLPAQAIAVANPKVPIVLGDSIPVYVVADAGKLDPFRAKVDRDMRRPFWLNQGDSMLFHVKDRIVIEDNLAMMKIRILGNDFHIYSTDSLAQVIINRDSIQVLLNR